MAYICKDPLSFGYEDYYPRDDMHFLKEKEIEGFMDHNTQSIKEDEEFQALTPKQLLLVEIRKVGKETHARIRDFYNALNNYEREFTIVDLGPTASRQNISYCKKRPNISK